MFQIVPHILILLATAIYAQLYDNEFFQMERVFENSIILTFQPDPGCVYDIHVSVWPPVINISEEGYGTVLFYEAPQSVDMEKITAHRKGELVHVVLPKRIYKMDRIPSDSKINLNVYQEIDIDMELSQVI
jgi:hypothetical protein